MMTADPATGRPRGTMIPLRAVRGRYRDFGDGYPPGDDPQAQAAWRVHLERTCDRVEGTAEVAGHLYRTLLFVPRDDHEVAYAEIGHNRMPIDVPEAPPIPSAYDAYATYLLDESRNTDFLTRDTRVSLRNAFIPPRFELLGPDAGGTVSWKELGDHARIVIVGDPGAGKTSCLRRLILDLLSPNPEAPAGRLARRDTMPVFIQLRDFPVADFGQAIIRRLINAEHTDELLAEFRPPLEGRRLLLAIDGLDELTTPREQVVFVERLSSLCRELPLLRVVLTTRDPLPAGELGDFIHLRLLPFDAAQIHQWTLVYLNSHNPHRSRWPEFIDLILYDSQFRHLAGNPLLLALASSMHWRYPDELNNRTGLLSKCVDVLVQDWDASRGIARWRDSDITPRQIKRLLNGLSFLLMKERRSKFTINDVTTTVSSMTGFRETPVVLLSACRTSGLIRDCGGDQYVFSYGALADYFAASEMVNRTSAVTEDIRDLSAEEDGRLFWRLTCALASSADELLGAAYAHGQAGMSPGDERAAAFMLAQALGEEISASSGLISKCADLVVTAVEKRLRDTEPLDGTATATRWPSHGNRHILWASGAVAAAGEASAANLGTSARLVELIYRARTGTASDSLRARLERSDVPLVREAARAFDHNGWCDHTVTPEGDRIALYIAVTGSAAANAGP